MISAKSFRDAELSDAVAEEAQEMEDSRETWVEKNHSPMPTMPCYRICRPHVLFLLVLEMIGGQRYDTDSSRKKYALGHKNSHSTVERMLDRSPWNQFYIRNLLHLMCQ